MRGSNNYNKTFWLPVWRCSLEPWWVSRTCSLRRREDYAPNPSMMSYSCPLSTLPLPSHARSMVANFCRLPCLLTLISSPFGGPHRETEWQKENENHSTVTVFQCLPCEGAMNYLHLPTEAYHSPRTWLSSVHSESKVSNQIQQYK